MDKGQHLRLFLVDGTSNAVIALSTEMTLHLSASTENSTTKDTSDPQSGPVWDEFEVLQRSGDIQFSALIASGTDAAAKTLNDAINHVNGTNIDWKIALASGTNNRTMGTVICSGKGKMVNVSPNGQVGQNASYSGTINIDGPVSVPS